MTDENVEQQAEAQQEGLTTSAFDDLMSKDLKLRKKDEHKSKVVHDATRTLAEWVLEKSKVKIVPEEAVTTVQSIIAGIDELLTAQINEILHNEELQKLEGAWRGLHYLINNTQSEAGKLEVKVFNISKKELHKTLRRFKGTAWDQSPLFKKIYEEEYGTLGGAPFGCLVGDYHFDHSPPDVELLGEMSHIAAAAHAPFIAGSDPSVLGMETWQKLPDPRELAKVFTTPDYAGWNSFRKSEDSRYVGLAMPRFLARLPYGAKTDPVEEFDFEELTESGDHTKYTWANSAYAMAVNINRAFKEWGWCSRIRGVESGGIVQKLPNHTFPTDDGGIEQKCPTEISITDRRENELAGLGFMPLIHRKGTDEAVFIGAQSMQQAQEYEDETATANARLSARLPYLFATCRFAHYLKCLVRDKIGSFMEKEDMQRFLQDWINNYVDGDPANSTEATKSRKPLADARVVVEADESNPGYYRSQFFLRPHYQLENLTVSLRLVSKIPTGGD